MDPVWLNFISFLAVYSLAIVSPGPNFILVVNTTLAGSRKRGLYTALGVATGSGLFGFAGLLGLLVIVNALPHFSMLIRLLGGGYLIWLGLKMVRNSFRKGGVVAEGTPAIVSEAPYRSWQTGLLTNLTNPKAWAFYLALFTVVITPGFNLLHKALLNLSMFLISFSWYALVVGMISSHRFGPLLQKGQRGIELVLGVLLLALGGRMFLSI
ncbi:MAG: hypothetical protein C0623_08725 [Desulfuromonas sp.]|nr:MAG: hypothetical protein C0623_08725 [Desulfuromonas sp.]